MEVSLDNAVTSSPTAISSCQFSCRTYLWTVPTFRLVPDNRITVQYFRTSVCSVLAGLFHLCSQILYSQVSGVQELLSAGRRAVHFRLADVTDLMTICIQCDGGLVCSKHTGHSRWFNRLCRFRLHDGRSWNNARELSVTYCSINIINYKPSAVHNGQSSCCCRVDYDTV